MLGLVDTAILGHLEEAKYLSAVAIGTSLLSFVFWGLAFLRMGTTGASAQARGRGAEPELVLLQASLLALAIAAGLLLIAPLAIHSALLLMNTPEASLALAEEYISIRLWGSPAQLLTFGVTGWLIGQQKARAALVITLVVNLCNIGLDWLLILEWQMNSRGAAIATVLSEYLGLAIALYVVRRELIAGLKNPAVTKKLRMVSQYFELLKTNTNLFIRTLVLMGSIMFFTSQGAAQGETILAANTILFNLMLLTAYGLDGFAQAAEALVGEAIGKKDKPEFNRICRAAFYWSLANAIIFCLIYWLGKPLWLGLMTDIPEVSAAASQYYGWLVILPLCSFLAYFLDGVFIGSMQTQWMRRMMIISSVCVYFPAWWLTQDWGNQGLWFAFVLWNLARSLSLVIAFPAIGKMFPKHLA